MSKIKADDPLRRISQYSLMQMAVMLAFIVLFFHYYAGNHGDTYFISRWVNLLLTVLCAVLLAVLQIRIRKLQKSRRKYLDMNDDSPSFEEVESQNR